MAGTDLSSTGLDLEKLRMAGAGVALAVLTSGGDAQGQSHRSPSVEPAQKRQLGGVRVTCGQMQRANEHS